MKLYGITQCDTVKKARTWLASQRQDIPFHDFKKAGIERELLERWLDRVEWHDLVNKKGTTWRQLNEAEKEAVKDRDSAIELMLKKPSVIRRPILESKNRIVVGFDETVYSEFFQNEHA